MTNTGLLDQPTTTTRRNTDPLLLLEGDLGEAIKLANEKWAMEARARDEEEIAADVRRSLEAIYSDHIEARRERSPKTIAYYVQAFSSFALWCVAQHALPNIEGPRSLPARSETVAAYLHALLESGKSSGQLRVASAAIQRAHRLAGHADPTADPMVAGVLRAARAKAPARKKKPRKRNGVSRH